LKRKRHYSYKKKAYILIVEYSGVSEESSLYL